MRGILVLVTVIGAAPICLIRPYFGILMWFWISVMPPSGYSWGLGARLPSALIIAIPTLVGTIFEGRNLRFLPKQMVLFGLFWAWTVVTYLHARQEPLFLDHADAGLMQLEQVSKILLMTLATILVVDSKERLRSLLLVTTFALGLLATKGAIWGIMTGGTWRVYGTPGSFIGDNNDFALALNMTLGIPFFLARETTNWKFRLLLRFLFCADLVCIVLSYSRGGLLALGAVVIGIAIKSRRKLLAGVLLATSVYGLLSFTTLQWQGRMTDFLHGYVDESAQQRLMVWKFAWNLAKAYPITGGGFECWTPGLFARLQSWDSGQQTGVLGPHSIYFQVLGEHGFPGLFLFLSLLGSCWYMVRRIRKAARGQPGLAWMVNYSHAIEIGFMAYIVGGAFLGRAYFDLYFELVACAIILRILFTRATATQIGEAPVSSGLSAETSNSDEVPAPDAGVRHNPGARDLLVS